MTTHQRDSEDSCGLVQNYMNLNNHLFEAFAGIFASIVAIYVGQPLDIIRVRLQTQGHLYAGIMDCGK
jgi:hypothetical protein